MIVNTDSAVNTSHDGDSMNVIISDNCNRNRIT